MSDKIHGHCWEFYTLNGRTSVQRLPNRIGLQEYAMYKGERMVVSEGQVLGGTLPRKHEKEE